jgi:hypothetical protein
MPTIESLTSESVSENGSPDSARMMTAPSRPASGRTPSSLRPIAAGTFPRTMTVSVCRW